MGDPSEAPCVAEWLWLSPRAVPSVVAHASVLVWSPTAGRRLRVAGNPVGVARGSPQRWHISGFAAGWEQSWVCAPSPPRGGRAPLHPALRIDPPDRWALPCGRGAVLPGRAGEMAFCRSLERVPASISWQGAEPRQRSIRAVISRAPERSVRMGGESSPPGSAAAPRGGPPVTAVLCFGSCRAHACHPEHAQTPVCLSFPDRQPGRRLFPAGPRAWRWSRGGERLVHPDVCLESNLEPVPWPGTPHSCPGR